MRYAVPGVSHGKGTVVEVNVGGAVIPTLISIYLLIKRELWVKGTVAIAIVALVIHWVAVPVAGLGNAVPVFMPVVVTAIVAVMLSREDSAPLAYIAGSLSTLIGVDLTNLDKVRGLSAPVASIGGAGTFDGISDGHSCCAVCGLLCAAPFGTGRMVVKKLRCRKRVLRLPPRGPKVTSDCHAYRKSARFLPPSFNFCPSSASGSVLRQRKHFASRCDAPQDMRSEWDQRHFGLRGEHP
jgi:hypothetical protein